MTKKRRVILVTDGDSVAQRAVETAVTNIGGRCISRSGGNPTPVTGIEIVDMIKSAKHDPVVVMVDDKGSSRTGQGEWALYEIANHPDIDIIGVIAVASNTQGVNGIKVDFSISRDGKIVKGAVDKDGFPKRGNVLYGDTVDIIERCQVPLIIGIGDIGKMAGKDDCEIGAPILTKAMEELISQNSNKKIKKDDKKDQGC
ncbi:stage V sporulation protein AE [Anaerosolibacter carboniphilus]|uniref:Stage V sporulation protein AE n=1 Tax=Anaerosolibacter carboniphilus TaxID=1417629 RepID=A0A841KYP6_9FIRM|nr:stage V sporulation protein AE [Anaerosolibacter carboniphilus]MBB6216022.1 stage V sporulation protein AE [Anaerosolibacter carboniphilus]